MQRTVKIAISSLAAGACAGWQAGAETLAVRPQICPVAANAPLIIDLGPLERADLYPASDAGGHVLIVYAPVRSGWARHRLLARFVVEDEAGELLGERAAPGPCIRRP